MSTFIPDGLLQATLRLTVQSDSCHVPFKLSLAQGKVGLVGSF